MHDIYKITMDQLHGILIAYEMCNKQSSYTCNNLQNTLNTKTSIVGQVM